MTDNTEFITDTIMEVADELLLCLDFYSPHNSKSSDYHFRLQPNLNDERFPKLQELYSHFSKLVLIMFMACRYGKNEISWELEDYELAYIGNVEDLSEDIDEIFELGRCWGEYISIFGPTNAEWWNRETPTIDGKASHDFYARFQYLKNRRKEWQKSGALANSEIGSASTAACQEFVKKNFPEGLQGRTKEYAYSECIVQIESLIKLENKQALQASLNDSDQKKYDNLFYLIALTKNKNGNLVPYKRNAIKTKMTRVLKK